jgi:hypothetical protein
VTNDTVTTPGGTPQRVGRFRSFFADDRGTVLGSDGYYVDVTPSVTEARQERHLALASSRRRGRRCWSAASPPIRNSTGCP